MGAGPGDPELLTRKAFRILGLADAVLYDHLANTALLALAPPAAERVYVGKKRSAHQFQQEEIARMLIERALAGKTVVRLKGGDPYLFGRGGEEAEALFDAGVPFEVVPGVASMSGLAAYAGIPLTHREHSSSVAVVTGHDPARVDWRMAAQADTLVILMGLTAFTEIATLLIAAGRSPQTPAAAVQWASRPVQRSIDGTLASLPLLIRESSLKPPATIVVGAVVALRPKLSWFEKLPLFGRRVLVTRAAEQSAGMGQQFTELGADVIAQPAIETRASFSPDLDRAIENLEGYTWLVFTSANGVRYFIERLDASNKDLRSIRGRICAIGPATAAALQSLHLKVALVGEEFVAESLLAAMPPDLSGERILIPRAAVARDILPAGLRARGAAVEVAETYRTEAPENLPHLLRRAFDDLRPADWVTFTSSSTVRNTVDAVGAERVRSIRVATIGPVTSATVRDFQIPVAAEASVYTSDGVVAAVLRMG